MRSDIASLSRFGGSRDHREGATLVGLSILGAKLASTPKPHARDYDALNYGPVCASFSGQTVQGVENMVIFPQLYEQQIDKWGLSCQKGRVIWKVAYSIVCLFVSWCMNVWVVASDCTCCTFTITIGQIAIENVNKGSSNFKEALLTLTAPQLFYNSSQSGRKV